MEIRTKHVRTSDGRVCLKESGGGGRVVVLLHGWTRSPRVWYPVMQATPPPWRSVAVDLVLESEQPRGGYGLDAMAVRIAAILDALEIDSALIAGHSMGGAIAMEFGLRYPDRTDGLVLVATGASAPGGGRGGFAREQLRSHGKTEAAMERILRGWFHRQPSAAEFEVIFADAMRWPVDALMGMRAARDSADQIENLSKLEMPVLVVHGELDATRPLSDAAGLASAVQKGRLLVVAGVGHTPLEEAPREFNRHFWNYCDAVASSSL